MRKAAKRMGEVNRITYARQISVFSLDWIRSRAGLLHGMMTREAKGSHAHSHRNLSLFIAQRVFRMQGPTTVTCGGQAYRDANQPKLHTEPITEPERQEPQARLRQSVSRASPRGLRPSGKSPRAGWILAQVRPIGFSCPGLPGLRLSCGRVRWSLNVPTGSTRAREPRRTSS
jgi:hypothetical protein